MARVGRERVADRAQRNAAGGGALYVVATPIGNLDDLGARAVEVLRAADLILAEDTRHSAKLLARFGIGAACRSFHEHNEARQVPRVVARVAAGERVALISDAGTPLISDPGYRLVAALRERGLPVVPVPGPNAAICALSVAGIATDRFCFEGFLPARAAARRRRLEGLADESRTLVFYESPRRVPALLADMAEVFGPGRVAVLAREMTKVHETIVQGTLAELGARLQARPDELRGEFVVVVAGAPAAESDHDAGPDRDALLRALLEELPLKQAVAVAARLTGARRNALYRAAVALADRAGAGDDA